MSKLIFLVDVDGGQYKCIAENKAGRVETNYTLNVGYFSGPGSLNTGEIVGITITVILLVMIIIVVMAVLTLKVKLDNMTQLQRTDHFPCKNSSPE